MMYPGYRLMTSATQSSVNKRGRLFNYTVHMVDFVVVNLTPLSCMCSSYFQRTFSLFVHTLFQHFTADL